MKFLIPLIVCVLAACAGVSAQTARRNVLLIIADDLRPQLGAYGDRQVKSPQLDRFAKTALRFERAYVQSAICSPSRNSFLSGLRPATTGLRGFGRTLRSAVPDVITLPQHFKNNGYHTAAIGKVFHFYAETGLGGEDDPASWSVPLQMPTRPVWGPVQDKLRLDRIAAARAAGKVFNHSHDWPRGDMWDAPDVADDELQDGEIATRAIAALRERAQHRNEPFFLAVGFLKPHSPYVAPKRYWDLYDAAKLRLPDNRTPPQGAPAFAAPRGVEQNYPNSLKPAGSSPDEAYQRTMLHAYLASISYMDAQAGRVLAALAQLKLDRDTIVIVIGDHGYQMGEHGSWGHKHTNYETSTRAPLLVRTPDLKARGQATMGLVEFVDLYPTLAELAALPAPAGVEGVSFAPLLTQPARAWKQAAFSEIQRGQWLGRALRTAQWRYVEWADKDERIVARELYDHQNDAQENFNLAALAERQELVRQFSQQLRAGWRAALPIQK
jgi:arylsulfatase A-like enzyme